MTDKKLTANIAEVFYSIQGEGLLVGQPTIFIRFTECNLHCKYCDTKRSLKKQKYCLYEKIPFSKKNEKIANDLTVIQLTKLIGKIKGKARYISFTGGEPLLHAQFIKEVVKRLGPKFYYLLETNGTCYKELKTLRPYIDLYSVDYKPGYEAKLELFLIELGKKKYYLKFVLERKSNIVQLIKTLKQLNLYELYLQPEAQKGVSAKKLQETLQLLDKHGFRYHVIPQMHKYLKIR